MIFPEKVKSISDLFLLALILRLLLMPLFYHPDLKSQHFHFQFLGQGISNIYQYIDENKQILPYRDTFNYLPLTYYVFGTTQFFSRPLMPAGFFTWLNDWGIYQHRYSHLQFYLLILKLPYLVADLILAWYLYLLTKNIRVLAWWLFNPLSFYLIYINGNFDIVPAALTVIAYYYLLRHSRWSFLLLGLAAALKLYPLLFLPFFVCCHPFNFKKYLANIFIFFLPLIVSLISFAFSPSFWNSFLGSGLTQKLFEHRFLNIPIFPVIYLFLFIRFFLAKSKLLPLHFYYLFLAFITLVDFHAQWLLWFFPFLFLVRFPRHPFLSPVNMLILILACFKIFITNDLFLTFGHLLAVDIDFLNLTIPYTVLKFRFHLIPESISRGLSYILAFLSAVFIFFYEKNKTN